MAVKAVLATIAALIVGVQVVRNAAVEALAQSQPDAAARVWSGHPAVELGVAMTDIARASRARRPIGASAFAQVWDVAAKQPLASGPFLVRGVQAEIAGDPAAAQSAFQQAQWRDPRSLPAAYFLSDRYLRSGDLKRGLGEVAILARLTPDGGTAAVPYLAQYAADPANWPALRHLVRANPQLAQPLLAKLAMDIRTASAALALGDSNGRQNAPWVANLVATLVNSGDYGRARAVWVRLAASGAQPGELLHDSGFHDRISPAPFNWQLTSSTVGLAERQGGGRLHVLFYGSEDGTLASQLLLLPPGPYQLSMKLLGDPARAHTLTWSIWCDKASQPLSSVTLDAAAARAWQFQVPAGCAAQWLKLSGTSADIPQQVDVSITALKLENAPAGA